MTQREMFYDDELLSHEARRNMRRRAIGTEALPDIDLLLAHITRMEQIADELAEDAMEDDWRTRFEHPEAD